MATPQSRREKGDHKAKDVKKTTSSSQRLPDDKTSKSLIGEVKPTRRLSKLRDLRTKPDEDLFASAVAASARRASISVTEGLNTTGKKC